MKKMNVKHLLQVALLICLTAFMGCSNEINSELDEMADAHRRTSNACGPFMVADKNIQDFYDANLTISRPADTHLKALLHYNINVSDFAASKKFYKLLGFANFIDQNINVTNPDDAQGLDLPPYSLTATPMRGKDGFIIDLIKFNNPYDDEAPNTNYNSIGFSSLHLKSSNLKKDRAYLLRNNVVSTLLAGTEETPTKIQFKDPDGNIVLLSQVGPVSHTYFFQKTKITGVYSTNINVTDLDASVAFYQEVGFQVIDQNEHYATIALSDGRHITLTASCSSDMAYEHVNHLGIARIAITTSDLNADMKILEAKGIKFFSPQPIRGHWLILYYQLRSI